MRRAHSYTCACATLKIQALTLLHECWHVAGDGIDIAYLHQPKFARLSAEETLINADSVSLLIFIAASLAIAQQEGADPTWLTRPLMMSPRKSSSSRQLRLRQFADWVRFRVVVHMAPDMAQLGTLPEDVQLPTACHNHGEDAPSQ